jgi:hypothetical protein
MLTYDIYRDNLKLCHEWLYTLEKLYIMIRRKIGKRIYDVRKIYILMFVL